MLRYISHSTRAYSRSRPVIALVVIVLLGLLLAACDSSSSQNTQPKQTTSGGSSFPTKAPPLRTPAFGSPGQVAPTVKVLASVDPTLIVQFPLSPAIINARQVLHDSSLSGTPFDGGGGPLHAGPQAMTDGQTLPVI